MFCFEGTKALLLHLLKKSMFCFEGTKT